MITGLIKQYRYHGSPMGPGSPTARRFTNLALSPGGPGTGKIDRKVAEK